MEKEGVVYHGRGRESFSRGERDREEKGKGGTREEKEEEKKKKRKRVFSNLIRLYAQIASTCLGGYRMYNQLYYKTVLHQFRI